MKVLRRNKKFRRLFLGRLITNAGDSLYLIGAMWLVYELTGSSFYTGLAGFLVQAPMSVQFLFGPLIDRWELRRVFVGTQLAQGILVLIIPIAAVTGRLSVWVILLVIPILSLLNQFVFPAQRATLPRIVESDELVSANSLLSTANQGTEMVFNAIAGIVLATVSATILFIADSITFGIAALLFSTVVIPQTDAENEEPDTIDSYISDLKEGIHYLRGSVVLAIMLGAMVANFGIGAMMAVFPQFADSLGGSATYGLLMASLAGGTLTGSIAAPVFKRLPLGYLSIGGFLLSGVFLFVALLTGGLYVILTLLFATFVPIGVFNIMFSTLMQNSVDEEFIGRISATVSSVTTVMLPIGNLLGGIGGETFTPASVMYLLSGLLALLGVYYLLHPQIRSLPSVTEDMKEILGFGPSPS